MIDAPTATTLAGARLADGRVRDVVVRDGRVTRVCAPGRADPRHPVLDLGGYVLLPAPAEPQIPLDRAPAWRTAGGDPGGRDGAARAWGAAPSRFAANDLRRRGRSALAALAGNGVTAVRAQLRVGGPAGASPRGIEVLRELAGEFASVLDLQIVVVPAPEAAERVVLDAFAAGARVLGGSPHESADVRAGTLALLRLADRADADLDVRVDVRPDPRVLAVGRLARLVRSSGFGRRVTASHLHGLSVLRPPALARVTEAIAGAGLGCVVMPPKGPAPGPAGAVRALLGAGVTVAAAGGRGRGEPPADPLGTAWLLVAGLGLTPEAAWAAVSSGAREAMALEPAGPRKGAVADLLAVRAPSLAHALAVRPQDRVVFRAGRPVGAAPPPRYAARAAVA